NLSIQIAGLNPPIREAQVTESQGIFDLTTRGSLRASESRILDTTTLFLDRVDKKPIPGQAPQGLIGQDNAQEHRLALGLSQLVPSGGTYDLEVSETHLSTTRRTTGSELKAVQQGRALAFPYPFRPRNDYYTSEAIIRGAQPLLRNFGSEVTKNQIL